MSPGTTDVVGPEEWRLWGGGVFGNGEGRVPRPRVPEGRSFSQIGSENGQSRITDLPNSLRMRRLSALCAR